MSKDKKTSERLKEIQEFVGLNNTEMAILLDLTEQMYELYIHGRFDNTDGIRQQRVVGRAVFLEEEIEKEIIVLQGAKERFAEYVKQSRRGTNGAEKDGKKSGKSPSSNGHNLKEKAAKG